MGGVQIGALRGRELREKKEGKEVKKKNPSKKWKEEVEVQERTATNLSGRSKGRRVSIIRQ